MTPSKWGARLGVIALAVARRFSHTGGDYVVQCDGIGHRLLGGPVTIAASEARILLFSFSIPTLDILRLSVSNGVVAGTPGFAAIACFFCSVGNGLAVSLDNRSTVTFIVSETVTPRSAVPEPSNLLLLGGGLAALRVRLGVKAQREFHEILF